MAPTPTIKPAHRAIQTYYEALRTYGDHDVTHETALRSAFQNLLAETGKAHSWTLIPEQTFTIQGKSIRPDGTLRDEFNLKRGYWEAKDTADDLDKEIKKKAAKGYPLTNTIFEDTRIASLYQNGKEKFRADLTDAQAVADLLNEFFSYAEPDIESFEQAVAEFKERIPDLAQGLDDKIKAARKDSTNKRFVAAFDSFYELCKSSLNPNISMAAVDEMLVQHLLTERLIRKIFDNPEFSRRNVIAAEIEKVIDALVSRSFNREDFMRSLDRFYRAIEAAAHDLEDFSEKQQFLNMIYERFFQGYNKKEADTHGIVYTPQPIVDFMCASVVEVLQTEFGKSLGDDDVVILDPATGTGNFIVNLIKHHIPARDLEATYRDRLFANEIMLLPYYIASINIEHAYFERTGQYEPFEGLCFVDTLDIAETRQLSMFAAANASRVRRQRHAPITVIIGNPPYNVRQQNENDNNKNRRYPIIDKHIQETYAKDSKARNKSALSDAYVKFMRWAVDRLQDRDGIVCMVTNNGFLDQAAFDGMRKHLLQDFTKIYHIDLHGNVRQNPRLSGTTHNVFGIQVGVGITIAIRSSNHTKHQVYYHRLAEMLRKEEKLNWLLTVRTASKVPWRNLEPDLTHRWLITESTGDFETFMPIGNGVSRSARPAAKEESRTLFKSYSFGVNTARDMIVYDFQKADLEKRIKQLVDDYNSEVDRYRRAGKPADIDSFVQYDKIKWSESLKLNLKRERYAEFNPPLFRLATYRPFTKRWLYFDNVLVERRYQYPSLFPTTETEAENRAIWIKVGPDWPVFPLMTHEIANLLPQGGSQSFSFYVYDLDGTNRRENITDWALVQFRTHYADDSITKWDIFYYVYAILHHPAYRTKFADNLKRDLPRIPFAPDFRAFATAGQQLADLHLNYETVKHHRLRWIETPGLPLSYHVEKMRLSKDKTQLVVNDYLTLADIPAAVYDYRLGNRSALEWIIDQYQVSTDKRSGITSDPNRADDPRYIVDLVERIVTVSLETVRLVASFPPDYTTAT